MVKKKFATSDNWATFKAEFDAWTERFGLTDWKIEHVHKKLPEARAKAEWDTAAMSGRITFSDDWTGEIINDYTICNTAFHEAMEIVLAELSAMALGTHNKEDVSRAVHAVIHRIEKVFYQPLTISPTTKATKA